MESSDPEVGRIRTALAALEQKSSFHFTQGMNLLSTKQRSQVYSAMDTHGSSVSTIPSDMAKEPLPLLLALSHPSVRVKMAGLLAVMEGVNSSD